MRFGLIVLFFCISSVFGIKGRTYGIKSFYLESDDGVPLEVSMTTDSTNTIIECQVDVFGGTVKIPGSEFGEYSKFKFNGINVTRYFDPMNGKQGVCISFSYGPSSRIWKGFSLIVLKDMSYGFEELQFLCPPE